MKKALIILLTLCFGVLNAQETVSIKANMKDCGSKLGLFEFKAVDFVPIQEVNASEDGSFEFQLKTEGPRLLYVGIRPNKVLPVMVGPEKTFSIEGSCRYASRSKISDSPLNGYYIAMKNEMNSIKRDNNILMRKMVKAQAQSEKDQAIAELKKLDERKMRFLDSMKQAQPFIAKVLALNTYLSYPNNQGSYNNEVEYFGNEFFRFADLKDPAYSQMPVLYDAFYDYTNTMLTVNLPNEMLAQFINSHLSKTPPNSAAHQYALGGIMRAMDRNKHDLYGTYAKLFINTYKAELPQITAGIERRYNVLTQFQVGKVAPDFTQNTPEGEELKLSDLRGKYILIDFWASWCGPCRRENPNVVRMYDKYKAKGFDILGVSLDRDQGRWLKAIEQDQLGWLHVSDLKGWQNAVAKQYNITSIPKTILLDPEGKIIGKNLRGPSLEQKLEEIFGDQ